MPEATLLVQGAEQKETVKGKPYWKAKGLKSWNVNLVELEGQQVQIEYEDEEFKGYTYKLVKKATVPQETPKLGTGEYVKAKTPKDDKLATDKRTCLMQATAAMAHTIGKDMTPKQASERILPLASAMWLWLITTYDGPDDAIPF